MTDPVLPPGSVTLDNCASEPIHIPGAIQPHGALLAFDADEQLIAWSANSVSMLGFVPVLGVPLASLPLPAEVMTTLQMLAAEAGTSSAAPASADLQLGDTTFDAVLHRHQGRMLVEFERRRQPADEVSRFALMAHRAIERLRREYDLDMLLGHAVRQVRALTGFDRVMAYRFRHDFSGEVAAESLREGLEPFLGQRYPASDIPLQARRLYTLNTLRMIADASYAPVPLVEPAGQAPVDMSYAGLRSVSPIHVEYLRNMGVQASMSVSIVVHGELWGMIACHHMSPLQVPYSVRMACDVLAQVLASSVTAISARREAEFSARGNALLSEIVGAVGRNDDTLAVLQAHAPELRSLLGADALVLAEEGKLLVSGELAPGLAKAALGASRQDGDRLQHWTSRDEWSDQAAALPAAGWVGLLALPFDKATRGVVLALRREQVEQVRWGGPPQKTVTLGPNGPRLTPRGSFTEWKETVRGHSEPWSALQLELAQRLLSELQRTSNARHAETQLARRQLLAMLGHDLRDPLQSISMVAAMMTRADEASRLGQRLASSSGRMQRLITQVMDMSRLDAGMRLSAEVRPTDLVPLLSDLIEEARIGHPGVTFALQLPRLLVAPVDGDRVAQLIGNLVSNARHHGAPGEPIEITLTVDDGAAQLRVANVAPPIEDARLADLFTPFRARDDRALLNRSGLGLGLFIAAKIASEHGGTLRYAHEGGRVCFYARLPLGEPVSTLQAD